MRADLNTVYTLLSSVFPTCVTTAAPDNFLALLHFWMAMSTATFNVRRLDAANGVYTQISPPKIHKLTMYLTIVNFSTRARTHAASFASCVPWRYVSRSPSSPISVQVLHSTDQQIAAVTGGRAALEPAYLRTQLDIGLVEGDVYVGGEGSNIDGVIIAYGPDQDAQQEYVCKDFQVYRLFEIHLTETWVPQRGDKLGRDIGLHLSTYP